MLARLVRKQTLLVRIENPLAIGLDLEHKELDRHVLLEVDHEKLVRLQSWHLSRLRLEIAAKNETRADGPDVGAAQILHVPNPNAHSRRLLKKGILRHERDHSFNTIECDESARR